ncbi:MAG: hypothetical protein FIA89_05285 [Geobacter sp.]|nr:hypothetical protein [Geobacter sp.]
MQGTTAIISSGALAAYPLGLRLLAIAALIVLAGSLMAKWEGGNQQATLERLISRVFIPCLVFASLNRTPLTLSEALIMAGAALLYSSACYPLARWWLSRNAAEKTEVWGPLLFSSSATLLLPLAYLLFGSQGLTKAAFFHLTALLLYYTVGKWSAGMPAQLGAFLKTPTLHAVLIALLLALLEIDLPQQVDELLWLVEKGIGMMALGALPVLLMSHGYALCCLRLQGGSYWSPVALIRALWLPLLAVLAIAVLRLSGLAPLDKGYDLLHYLDLRTTEAILLLAAALPCTVSLLQQPKTDSELSPRTTSLVLASSLYALFVIVLTVMAINRYLFSS